ncbi:pectinesterase family protein [Sphingobacterium spiritivorum]|uniref:pectinesterase family protein n=1 Tax=Sphingobacterium spiritivorum TaxID=258 RepID=UPI00191A78FD|nr:pectinesterase family protein [Sphingobacterium spiritivorum]QQT26960.1 pectin esterase [Sphingobacterium spiritivorum]
MRNLVLFTVILFTGLQYAVARSYDYSVAQDGSGQFKTVQEALNAVPDFRKTVTTIYIKNGIYKEKLILAGSKQNVRLIGEQVDKTILTYEDFAQRKNTFGEEKGTSGSSSVYLYGDGFVAENITFQNSAGPVGQAVAVWVASDRAVFSNCRFLGFQDTLYTYGKGSRQYYYNCYIEGTVDYIFGSSTAWFEECELHCKNSGYITAASTPDTVAYGYVFNKCHITGDKDTKRFYLGRPWRPYAKVIFMNSQLPAFIAAEGWHNWGKESNEQTVYYAEYNNTGTGSLSQNRVKWSHQLSEDEARKVTLEAVFKDWNPLLSLR